MPVKGYAVGNQINHRWQISGDDVNAGDVRGRRRPHTILSDFQQCQILNAQSQAIPARSSRLYLSFVRAKKIQGSIQQLERRQQTTRHRCCLEDAVIGNGGGSTIQKQMRSFGVYCVLVCILCMIVQYQVRTYF